MNDTQAQAQIMNVLRGYFTQYHDGGPDYPTAESLSSGTGIDRATVERALAALYEAGRIEGTKLAEYDYPVDVTAIR
jgi:DNA-binding transcriptional regulator YhcF (GntR family)